MEWGLPIAAHAGEYKSQLPSLARLALEGNNISGPSDPWPGGGAVAFSPDFLCTGRPGNPLMYKGLVVPPLGSGGGGLSAGAVAGIVVGSVAAAALVAALASFLLVRRRRRRAAASPAAAAGPAGSVEDKQSGEGGGAGVAGFDSESDLEKGSVVTSDRSPHLSGTTNTNATASLTGSSNAGLLAVDTDARQLPSEWNTGVLARWLLCMLPWLLGSSICGCCRPLLLPNDITCLSPKLLAFLPACSCLP